jgi:hypothetical protein
MNARAVSVPMVPAIELPRILYATDFSPASPLFRWFQPWLVNTSPGYS